MSFIFNLIPIFSFLRCRLLLQIKCNGFCTNLRIFYPKVGLVYWLIISPCRRLCFLLIIVPYNYNFWRLFCSKSAFLCFIFNVILLFSFFAVIYYCLCYIFGSRNNSFCIELRRDILHQQSWFFISYLRRYSSLLFPLLCFIFENKIR